MTEKFCRRCEQVKPIAEFYEPPGSYCRVCVRRYSIEWRLKYPGRRRAHAKIAAALKYGEIVKPENCQRCGQKKYLVGHHHDYRKPLDVLWVCDACHGKIHAELRRAARENGKKGRTEEEGAGVSQWARTAR